METFAGLFLCLVLTAFAAPAANGPPDRGTGKPDIEFAKIGKAFRRHCARVFIHGKSHAGKLPPVDECAEDIMNERPTPAGGYWWDGRHVVIEDKGLQDDFIRAIEVGTPDSDKSWPARVAGRFRNIRAVLVEVFPDAAGRLPDAVPLEFAEGDPGEAFILSYSYREGEWIVSTEGGFGAMALSDRGRETSDIPAAGVWVNEEGTVLGLAMGERLDMGGRSRHWSGPAVAKTPIVRAPDVENARRALGAKIADSVLEVRFGLRVKIDEEDEASAWSAAAGKAEDAAAEVRAAGLVVDSGRLLVPLPLQAEAIARIEEIAVRLPDGRETAAEFIGAARDYLAVVVGVGEELPTASLPHGFARLNPLAADPPLPSGAGRLSPPEYFTRWRVDYELGRRRETVDYDRWLGLLRGYRDDPVVLTMTDEDAGSMAFDRDGGLVALALAPRVLHAPDGDGETGLSSASFRPLDALQRRFRRDDFFDPALRPVDEDEGRRLIDPGVEYQGLDANTSRLFTAAAETRGGEIGMLVTHVYPGSAADAIGLREHDILLRIFFEGKSEPVELKASDDDNAAWPLHEFSDMAAERSLDMPPPWPSRENGLSLLLTEAGVGRTATLEYLREGELERAEFVTAYAEPDYRNAKKRVFPRLGLAVKPVTYETVRFFRRRGPDGVLVSRVEEGGKAAVAGLFPYLLITHVDGRPVAGADDFQDRMEAFEADGGTSVELTLEGFGKTRLARIER